MTQISILFFTAQLPEFTPPLSRSAGLLSELASQHVLSLAYFERAEDKESDRQSAARLCTKVIKLNPRPENTVTRWLRRGNSVGEVLLQQLAGLLPEIIQAEDAALARLVQPLLARHPGSQLFTFYPDAVETDGRSFPFGPGLDINYFRRQTPTNITSKEFLFSIRTGDKKSAALNRQAVEYLSGQVWPLVRERHPDATLKIKVELGPTERPTWAGTRRGDGRKLEYGTILPIEYETARLGLAPYLEDTPANPQPWLEAWAMQLPLITLPAAAYALEKLGAKLGDHFLKGEDAPSLAALMSRLLEIRRPGLHLAEAGRQLVEARFSWAAWAGELEKIYEDKRNNF